MTAKTQTLKFTHTINAPPAEVFRTVHPPHRAAWEADASCWRPAKFKPPRILEGMK